MHAESYGSEPARLVSPAEVIVRAWMQVNSPAIDVMTQLGARFLQQLTRAGNAWNGFLSRRLNEDIATSRRLLQCETPVDVVTAYADFFARAQQQYLAEFQYFARLNQKLADETAGIVRHAYAAPGSDQR
jgi:hypothetical protein